MTAPTAEQIVAVLRAHRWPDEDDVPEFVCSCGLRADDPDAEHHIATELRALYVDGTTP